MTDLVTSPDACEADCCASGPHVEVLRANFYCWPCRAVHQFKLEEVEQIVYALGAAEQLAYELGRLDEAAKLAERATTQLTQCLKTTLRDADNPEVFLEHVEQGIECRKAAGHVHDAGCGDQRQHCQVVTPADRSQAKAKSRAGE